jgi:hypothetical protein
MRITTIQSHKIKMNQVFVQSNQEKVSEFCPPALTNKSYSFGEEIGSGSYSKVYKAKKKSYPDRVCSQED